MAKLFFTADTHFGHPNIIRCWNRPFASVREMDRHLIEEWNAVVSDRDIVCHLGDFCLRRDPRRYLDQLNGQIHLVLGNHDSRPDMERAGRFLTVSKVTELRHEGERAILCHHPRMWWPGAEKGVWHLFGHVHGRYDHVPHGRSIDVGVDSRNYRPMSFEEVADAIRRAEAGRDE